MGSLAGVFILIVLACFIYHECYLKKKKIDEASEAAKSQRNSARNSNRNSARGKAETATSFRKRSVTNLKSETD